MPIEQVRSQEWIDKIEELVRQAEAIRDPKDRAVAIDLLKAVVDFHGAALGRVMEIAAEANPEIVRRIAEDDLTGSLLLLHDLHPDDLETRVQRAVDKLEGVFSSLGAKLSILAIEPENVRLQFDSNRAWTGAPVRDSIEKVILQAAPEIQTIVIEGLKEPAPSGFVPVSELLAGSRI